MTQIRLTNSATRSKEDFVPLDPERVRMYVCGPTVYDRAHMGNARSAVVFDTLYRLLRQVYGAKHVTYVRNITDVDDKINARAAESGRSISDITAETSGWYFDDMGALGCLTPDENPRATAHIGGMIEMISDLIAKGHAYEAEGHVLFSVSSYEAYGALSGRSVDDMIAGARVEVAPYKRDPMDFVLWKPSEAGLPGWESPWGVGRPGWHIECSVMSEAFLGETFDIHGGGGDLQFPHHENEIAQSVCAHGGAPMARYWLHNEMLQVEGRKMSKSLGNFFTVRDKLDSGLPGEVMRFVLLSAHYRKPMDWTEQKVKEATAVLDRWFFALNVASFSESMKQVLINGGVWQPDEKVVDCLADDLNLPGAIARLHEIFRPGQAVQMASFAASLELIGLINDWDTFHHFLRGGVSHTGEGDRPGEVLVQELLLYREDAKAQRNYDLADRIRDSLINAGVVVKDSRGGSGYELTRDFDSSKLPGPDNFD
ncbi:cysteine--tRNA ligase [Palleronia caenipelagi]|uniref:Cysteine--tRNA ligase n=1 Tax=Palleronia caenipelagi TaxID=2489174 RepID=A0A547PXR1_9RHOB|nr:cysteine--tRNA ligase [Palleronia caenipelagi]TRD18947.1 cysteine--tRNA ligase [Palleronia caenipelagi]